MDTISKNNPGLREQVSFVIKHHVKPDHHEQYEVWLKKTIKEAAKYPGHLGTHVTKPADGSDNYETVVRFSSRAAAEHWIESETRKNLVDEVAPYIAEPEKLQVVSGIDYWFTNATEDHIAPKRWKQWLTSVSVIWPLTIVIPLLFRPLFRAIPFLGEYGVSQLVVAMAVVFMVVYVVMPPYTRALSKWLSR